MEKDPILEQKVIELEKKFDLMLDELKRIRENSDAQREFVGKLALGTSELIKDLNARRLSIFKSN